MKQLRVFIGMESSAVVRGAFEALGHYAVSCDLLPSEKHGRHHKGDVLDVLYGMWNDGFEWDIVILHPPCTFLTISGLHWNKRVKGREEKTEEALQFVCDCLNAPVKRLGLENPVGCIGTRIVFDGKKYVVHPTEIENGYKPTQII